MRLTTILSAGFAAAILLSPAAADDALVERIAEAAHSLEDEADLDPLLDRIGDERYVLLGEASHGTAEFYEWRAAISRRLIEEKGVNFIAVEGDWALSYRLNRYVKDLPGAADSARAVLEEFDRWPRWMWANEQIVELAEWMRSYNEGRNLEDRVGFYGIDVYNTERSLEKLRDYAADQGGALAEAAEALYECFGPHADSPQGYAMAVAQRGVSCANAAEAMVEVLRDQREALEDENRQAYFSAKQNAYVVKNGEWHYRAMLAGPADSWNARAQHFFDTAERLMAYHGPDSRGIVWAHNTHIGDARATDMAAAGQHNIGQLVREAHGEDQAVLVGFSTYRGSVLAGPAWEAPMQEMQTPEGRSGSYEDLFHRTGKSAFLLVFDDELRADPALQQPRPHRAVGVVYNPAQDQLRNYVNTVLPERYDALIFIEETQALDALHEPGG